MRALVYRGPGLEAPDRILDAYDTFGRAAETHVLKVIIEA